LASIICLFMRYFLHKDLQGSTNIVTDDTGLVFQHIEYFPSGETWIEEHSDVYRTPYLYDGGYFDEWRNLIDLGARWYEPREQFMYSTDPVLESDPAQLIDDPALSPAYSYAESNPLRLVDPDGRRPSAARQAFGNAFGRAANSFKQWGRIQPGSAASRRLVGGWGSRLAGITPRTTDRLRTIGQRFNGISERDGVTSEFEVPAFIKIYSTCEYSDASPSADRRWCRVERRRSGEHSDGG
jgi:RHS repeat-associated protein